MFESPTEKQLAFIKSTEGTTGVPFNYEKATKNSAREYISKNISYYKYMKNLETNIWALEHGYF